MEAALQRGRQAVGLRLVQDSFENGIATLPGGRPIWFKDPDGNILNTFERD